MTVQDLIERAREVRAKYADLEMKKYGKTWTPAQLAQGFVGDVGMLMKLVTAKEGVRDTENVDQKLAHELSDCLWSVIVLADAYGIDLEASFASTMNELEGRIARG